MYDIEPRNSWCTPTVVLIGYLSTPDTHSRYELSLVNRYAYAYQDVGNMFSGYSILYCLSGVYTWDVVPLADRQNDPVK